MPGETPAPTPEQVDAEMTRLTRTEVDESTGQEHHPIVDKELSRLMAEKELAAHDKAEGLESQLRSDSKNLRKSDGELVARARSRIDKVVGKGEEAAEKAGLKAVEIGLKERAVKEKGRVENIDESLERAYAEKPELDMAANLKAVGSEDLAKGRTEAAKAHAGSRGSEYNDSAARALKDIGDVLHGSVHDSVLRGSNLDGYETVKQAFAGRDAEPVYEVDKGRGKRSAHESVYASTSNPNVVMIERRNARTGEIISVHTVATKSESLETRKGAKVPSRELRGEMRSARTFDSNPDSSRDSLDVINSKGPNLAYGDAGEYGMLQRRRLTMGTDQAEGALADYRAKRKRQHQATPWWTRLFRL